MWEKEMVLSLKKTDIWKWQPLATTPPATGRLVGRLVGLVNGSMRVRAPHQTPLLRKCKSSVWIFSEPILSDFPMFSAFTKQAVCRSGFVGGDQSKISWNISFHIPNANKQLMEGKLEKFTLPHAGTFESKTIYIIYHSSQRQYKIILTLSNVQSTLKLRQNCTL